MGSIFYEFYFIQILPNFLELINPSLDGLEFTFSPTYFSCFVFAIISKRLVIVAFKDINLSPKQILEGWREKRRFLLYVQTHPKGLRKEDQY